MLTALPFRSISFRKGYAPFFLCLSLIIGLPVERFCRIFEGADNLISYPAPVEVTFLGLNFFTIDIAGIHLAWIDGYVIGNTTYREPWDGDNTIFLANTNV